MLCFQNMPFLVLSRQYVWFFLPEIGNRAYFSKVEMVIVFSLKTGANARFDGLRE
jgi:hypothetical protein